MISRLRGTLLEAATGAAVLDVGGVGFDLGISATTAAELPSVGSPCTLFTRLVVREDALSLFGFSTSDERRMFDRLVAVSGVGSRLALAVLSTFTPAQLYRIVMAEDDVSMATVPGVGKKTAQRLILELKGVLAKDGGLRAAALELPSRPDEGPGAGAAALDEARAALLSMGFSPQEAALALEGYDGEGAHVEDLLGFALRRLGTDR